MGEISGDITEKLVSVIEAQMQIADGQARIAQAQSVPLPIDPAAVRGIIQRLSGAHKYAPTIFTVCGGDNFVAGISALRVLRDAGVVEIGRERIGEVVTLVASDVALPRLRTAFLARSAPADEVYTEVMAKLLLLGEPHLDRIGREEKISLLEVAEACRVLEGAGLLTRVSNRGAGRLRLTPDGRRFAEALCHLSQFDTGQPELA